jgi:hypothetical protein
MSRPSRSSLGALLVAPMALLAFSCVTLAAPGGATPRAASPQATASASDLSGVWFGDGGGNNRNLLLAPARPLMQPWVKAKFDSKGVTTETDPFLAYCDPLSTPRVLLTNIPHRIVQTPSEVVFLYERNHDFREVYTDGRTHPKDLDPSWWGHSIGRWDGNALVVDTIGFNDKTWLDWSGLVHTEALHLVERYERIDHDDMRLDVTIDDPKAYTQSFTAKRMFKLKPWDLMEDICTRGDEQHFRQGIVDPAGAPPSK